MSTLGFLWDGESLEFTIKADSRAELNAKISQVEMLAGTIWPMAPEAPPDLERDPVPNSPGWREDLGLA